MNLVRVNREAVQHLHLTPNGAQQSWDTVKTELISGHSVSVLTGTPGQTCIFKSVIFVWMKLLINIRSCVVPGFSPSAFPGLPGIELGSLGLAWQGPLTHCAIDWNL